MANITKVYLMNTLLEKDYAHTMYFSSASAQQSYFQKRIQSAMTFTDFSYQRKDHIIRIPKHIDSLYAAKVNYCMYQNADYSNKWFYAFITDMKYINDELTEVHIQTDCIQTWMFDITIKHSFVEREHATSDQIGEHTIDEGLELGEFICNKHSTAGYTNDDLSVCIAATQDPEKNKLSGNIYAGLYSGVNYYSFDSDSVKAINDFLAGYDSDAAAEAINSMFIAPRRLAKLREDNFVPGQNWVHSYYINPIDPTDDMEYKAIDLSQDTLEGYEPENKKLMCYPYRYLLISNNSGAAATLRYERFFTVDGSGSKTAISPRFVIEGALCPGCSIRMVPLNYNGAPRNDEEGLNMGKFPILNWSSDVYTNWLTQNGVNIALQVVSGVGQIAAGAAIAAATGGVGMAVGGGSIVGGVSQIAGTLAQIHQQSLTPPQAKGNINAGDVVTASDQNDFHFYDMSIRAEYAKIIDEYFNMFGYKCNRVKVPAKNHRQNYWYTKTIDANIIGGIPQGDLQTIKDCYNRGITFWKTEDNFRNYSVSNNIV